MRRGSMAEALIGLGGNVGDARATLDQAVAAFCDGAAVRLLARSSDYRTPPWGVEDQPPFINLCLAVATSLAPGELLARGPRSSARLAAACANPFGALGSAPARHRPPRL